MHDKSLKTVTSALEIIFSKLNRVFFDNSLKMPIMTVAPDTKTVDFGWYTSWRAWSQNGSDGYFEINICADHLSRPIELICAAMLHEMVHMINFLDGVKDTSRSGKYHNLKFKETAEAHGLETEKSETYGWSKTVLSTEAKRYIQTFKLPDFTIRRPKVSKLEKRSNSRPRRYVCPKCGIIIRATRDVNVTCTGCNVELEERK